MVDESILCNADGHKVKMKLKSGKIIEAVVDFFESAYSSGYNVASIGLSNGVEYLASDIKSLEIID